MWHVVSLAQKVLCYQIESIRQRSSISNFKDKVDIIYRLIKAKGNVIKRLKDNGKSSIEIITTTEDKEQYWKRVLIVDDDPDVTTTFKVGIENSHFNSNKKIGVHIFNDPRVALLDFQPNFYDLLLTDINMPYIDGFQLSEKILSIDLNVKICFMSAGEINRDALREIHPTLSFGCFIRKPVTIDNLIDRIMAELD